MLSSPMVNELDSFLLQDMSEQCSSTPATNKLSECFANMYQSPQAFPSLAQPQSTFDNAPLEHYAPQASCLEIGPPHVAEDITSSAFVQCMHDKSWYQLGTREIYAPTSFLSKPQDSSPAWFNYRPPSTSHPGHHELNIATSFTYPEPPLNASSESTLVPRGQHPLALGVSPSAYDYQNPYTSYAEYFTTNDSDCNNNHRPDENGDPSDETDGDKNLQSTSYARLIYAALMAAPGHKMVLKDIYRWIKENTDKANDPMSTGWQNSVRHNLSMNQARVTLGNPMSSS